MWKCLEQTPLASSKEKAEPKQICTCNFISINCIKLQRDQPVLTSIAKRIFNFSQWFNNQALSFLPAFNLDL